MDEDQSTGPFKIGGALDALGQLDQQQQDALIDRTLGDYRIVSLLGQGGMSTVYRAERVDGSFDRDVAVKISYLSGMDERARDRFLAEQQILAGLNHPNITHLYDAGISTEGWPYIVMELIEGLDIVAYCQAHKLDLGQRLRLLLEVVDAVSYAHTRLILHRDIKPSNVIVGHDGLAKLLDFGIARPLDATLHTQTRGAMTPRYASPEQILGGQTTVTSDVYQLGLLAYEVLTGKVLNETQDPLSLKRNLTAGTSVRVPAESRQQLTKDCVAIIEQCLRLSADERYRDAAALGSDIRALLQGYPVSAVGQNFSYRLGKYVARNRSALSAVGFAVLALVGTSSWYLYQVTKERNFALEQQALAEESLNFMASFFQAANPVQAKGETLTAVDVLQQGAQRAEEELQHQPAIQRRLFEDIALSFYRLEQLSEAEKYIRKTIALDEALGFVTDNVLDDYYLHQNLLASILGDKGEFQAAWDILFAIHEKAKATLGPMHRRTLKAQANLGVTAGRLGNLKQARAILQDEYEKRLEVYGAQHEETLTTALNLIGVLGRSGDMREAHELAQRSVADAAVVLGEQHPVSVRLLANLSQTTLDLEGAQTALPIKRDMVAHAKKIYGEDNFYYLGHLAHLGSILGRTGALEESEQAQLDAIQGMSAIRGAENPRVLIARSNLVSTWIDMGQYDKARAELDEITPLFSARAGTQDPNVFFCRSMYLKILVYTGDPEARGYAETLYQDLVNTFGEQDQRAIDVKTTLSEMQADNSGAVSSAGGVLRLDQSFKMGSLSATTRRVT